MRFLYWCTHFWTEWNLGDVVATRIYLLWREFHQSPLQSKVALSLHSSLSCFVPGKDGLEDRRKRRLESLIPICMKCLTLRRLYSHGNPNIYLVVVFSYLVRLWVWGVSWCRRSTPSSCLGRNAATVIGGTHPGTGTARNWGELKRLLILVFTRRLS